jgi:putative transposase
MRTTPMANDCYYHVYNRGVDRRDIFLSDEDRRRFLRGCILFNDEEVIARKPELSEDGSHPRRSTTPLVSILCYALMNNHVHFIFRQSVDDGVARFMQRLGTGYTKYFNRRYDRTGALFESTYKAVLIQDDRQFLHSTRYVHLNPFDIFEGDEDNRMEQLIEYPWSSFRHYIGRTNDPVIHPNFLSSMMSAEEYFLFLKEWIPHRDMAKLSFNI